MPNKRKRTALRHTGKILQTDVQRLRDTDREKMPPKLAATILPNYERIRTYYLGVCSAVSVIILVFQIALFLALRFRLLPLEMRTTVPVHLIRYLLLPSALNFGSVLIAWLMHRYYRKSQFFLNCAPIFSISMICSVTASAHSMYSITLMLLCLPLLMSCVYGRPGILLFASGTCTVGLAVATWCRTVCPYRDQPDTKLIPEVVGTGVFLVTVTFISLIMIALLNTQKSRLIAATQVAEEARLQAQRANQAKSEFLASMSHEIRTPLNAIIGMNEIIARRTMEPETREYAGAIVQASNNLLAIINDVLDISKIESGRVEIQETNYELGSLINDSYNMVAVRWREKGLTAAVLCEKELPRTLHGDEYHLRQIIVNLLSNAAKYTNEGRIDICVSGEREEDTLWLVLSVKDTGIGIKEEDIPKVFGMFYRLNTGRNQSVEGTGLGLSIVKQLVELMDGTIQVESIYGVGSTFTVRIPQKIADPAPIGDIHSTYLNVQGEIEEYHQCFEAPEARILLVDDVKVNLQVVCRLLEETKIKVDTASSGRECLKKVRARRYDLILMDHMMPEMDGIETIRAMHKLADSRNKGVPVIMLTANAMVGAREEYLKEGFTDYLSKPIRGSRLERVILRFLPEEKVHIYTRTEPAGEAPAAEAGFSLERLSVALPEIDFQPGLAYCAGDEDFYRSMLKEFAEGGRDVALETHLSVEDWSNYRITAHSLKSAARLVGLTGLSDESLILEKAAKSGDIPTVRAHHAEVIAHYRHVAEILKELEL